MSEEICGEFSVRWYRDNDTDLLSDIEPMTVSSDMGATDSVVERSVDARSVLEAQRYESAEVDVLDVAEAVEVPGVLVVNGDLGGGEGLDILAEPPDEGVDLLVLEGEAGDELVLRALGHLDPA